MTTSEVPIQIELTATTEALVAAHEAHTREALEGPLWERRGFLQRLARRNEPG